MSTVQSSIILIVDDQPTNLKMLFSFLQEAGFKVLVAKTGESALKKLQKVSPDLILLDVMMPGIDGFETCRRLKASAETRDIPVMFMTALSESMDKIKGLKVGAVDYITKPFQQEEVLARITNQIKFRRLQKQLEEQNKQLQQSQHQLQGVLNSSLDGVAAFSAVRDDWGQIVDFKWLLLNPTAAKILGRTESQLVGKQLLVEIPGHRETGLFEKYVRVVETGEALETEHYYNYEQYQAWLQVAAVKLGDGFAVTFRDITERKRMEEQNQALLDALPDKMFRQRVDGTYLDVKAKEGSLFAPTEGRIGKNLLDMPLPEDVKQGIFKHLQAAGETGELQTYEYELPMPDGLHSYEARFVKSGADEVIRIVRDVTERKRAEAALRESEARFRGIFESAAIAIGLTEADGRLIKANPTFEAFLGYSEAEMCDLNFPNVTYPDDRETDSTLTREVIDGVRDSFQIEKRYIRKDGQIFWGRVTVSAVRNEKGEFQFTVGLLEDINDRKLREIALRESERRFRAIFNNSFQLTVLLKPNGTVIEVNQTALDLGGVKPADVAKLPFWQTCWWRERAFRAFRAGGVHTRREEKQGESFSLISRQKTSSPSSSASPASPALSPKQEQLREAIAGAASGQFVRYEVDIRGVGNSAITLDFSIKPVFDETGNVVLLLAEGRDITERKKAEERLRLLESVVVNTNDAVIIAEAEPVELPGPRIIYVNQAFSRMTGYTPEEVMGKTPRILQGPQTDRNELRKIRKALKTWQSERVEVINYRKDGSEFWVEFEVVPVADEAGWYTHWVSVQRDITDRKVAEQKLRETTNLYQQILDAIPDFVLCKATQSRIIYANRAFRNYYGMTQEQLQGIIDAPFVKPDYTQQYVKDDTYVFNTGETLKIEEPVVRYDRQERLFSTVKSAIFDERGQVIQTVGVSRDITERKQAEERLRLLERAIAASNNGIFISDATAPKNPIIYVNSGFERMTGYRKEEVLGKKCCSFDPTCTMPAVLEQLQCANTEGKETQVTLRNSRKDGTHFWCELCITPVRDASGRLTNFIGVLTDIGDRIAVQESLRESEERFRTMADSTAVMLWVSGKDGQSTFVNKTWLEFTGRTLEEELSISWLEDIHPDERQRCLEQYLAAVEARESFEIEYRLRRLDGEYRWIVDLGKPRFTPNGSFAGYIGSCIDITERKQAEIEIKTAKAALERQIQWTLLLGRITQEIRSSLKVEQIFQTAATQIGKAFGVNRCLIHTYVDYPIPEIPLVAEYKQPGLESILGLVIPVIGNPHAELMLSLDSAIASDDIYAEPLLEDASSVCQHLGLKSMLAVRTSYQGKPNGAIGLHQYDRFRHWCDEEIELLEAVAAQVGIAIAQANLLQQEKNRRRELAAQNHALERAKLDAEAANRAKSQFLSKMSHELRTPLNAILGFTQVMARNNSLTSEQTEHLEIINRSGEHLLELINDILSMSKIEAGQVTLNENCFNLYRLLDSLEEMLRLKASSKGLQLIFERVPDVPHYIRADESKLRQVLINLLGNAIKFTQQGSVMLRVGVGHGGSHTRTWRNSYEDMGHGEEDVGHGENLPPSPSSPYSLLPTPYSLSFAVEDTGPGIAPQELDTLFDPFVQTQTGRKSMEGTGLGLPISQHFVRIMGGDISVRSTLGQGSIFTFDIQVGLATSADEEPISSKRRVISLEPNQPSYRILIVEDAAVNRKLLVEMLEPLGFEVCEAANGQEGVALWESWSPHLILMDIIMPVMDGYEATWQIKRLSSRDALLRPKGQSTAIIALTASAFEEQRDAVLRAGCDDFIPKPFREEVLLEKIALHLGVSYVYEEQQPSKLPQLPDFVEQLSPEALAVMPASWVTQLHQAALYADEEIMNQLIEQITLEHAFLRRALKALVDNFQLEQIINLTEPAE